MGRTGANAGSAGCGGFRLQPAAKEIINKGAYLFISYTSHVVSQEAQHAIYGLDGF